MGKRLAEQPTPGAAVLQCAGDRLETYAGFGPGAFPRPVALAGGATSAAVAGSGSGGCAGSAGPGCEYRHADPGNNGQARERLGATGVSGGLARKVLARAIK